MYFYLKYSHFTILCQFQVHRKMIQLYINNFSDYFSWASLITQSVENLLVMQETQVRFLGREDPLEKKMATHSRIFAWRIPWTKEPSRLQSMGSQESDTTQQLNQPQFHVYVCVYVCTLIWCSCVQLFVTLWTVAHQAPLPMGFSRQEYWSGMPCPLPGDLIDPGIEPKSPAASALQWILY